MRRDVTCMYRVYQQTFADHAFYAHYVDEWIAQDFIFLRVECPRVECPRVETAVFTALQFSKANSA